MSKLKTAITPTRAENYPEWYQQVIKAADLAEVSPVRGCMVIKPWGYAIWESIQRYLDYRFKETGHQNVYFPLFIPISFLEREAEHVDGFAKECAVVTHRRLAKNEKGELIPVSPLDEPLIVRPTSETIIGEMFSRWIHSHRDLPVLINQWANVVRWEMRTRLFLRTTEFLWQEGHTAHATEKEARAETLLMLEEYRNFLENVMAIPVIVGEKTESEKFPGAENTYCIEAMMQDGKALQAGTSHFLGQHFAKAFNIQFTADKGESQYVWTTSWGVSTRLIGALIMVHSDDDGLVVPPRLAPEQIVIIVAPHGQDPTALENYCEALRNALRELRYNGDPLRIYIDKSDRTPGEKAWSWYKKGVPIQFEVGPRELANQQICVRRRDKGYRPTQTSDRQQAIDEAVSQLEDIQKNLYERAQQFLQAHTVVMTDKKDFYEFFQGQDDEQPSRGFVQAYWAGDADLEKQLKDELKVTIRCLPLADQIQRGTCIFTQRDNARIAIFARAY